MRKTIFDILRIIIGVLFTSILISDLLGITHDPITYERVYTGEFLGKMRYASLSQLKSSLILQIIITSIYLILSILHLFFLKNRRSILSAILIIFDIAVFYCLFFM